jgi:Ras family protein A
MWHARTIKADRYLECSALTGEGVDTLIEEAGLEASRRVTMRTKQMRETGITEEGAMKKRRL